MPTGTLPIYFTNPAGQILEHPNRYAIVRYHPGPRQETDLHALLTHLGHMPVARGWNRVIGDTRQMLPFSESEKTWIDENWGSRHLMRPAHLWVAMLQPTDVFAHLAVGEVQSKWPAP